MIRRAPWTGDATSLEDDLRRSVRGEVRFDAGSRAVYATDASNYRQVPIGVVVPVDDEDLVAAVAACRRQGAPIVHRGAGTSLAGQSCNVAVVIDSSRHLTGVIGIDPERRTARVRPGTVLDDLRGAALRHGLTFGPDPATHAWCTVGGMIGNNSCGVHSLTTGRTSDNVEELEILTYDGLRLRVGATPEREIDRIVRAGGRRGEIYRRLRELRDRYAGSIRERFPRLSRRVSGYNLDDLLPERGFHVARALAGTEGTCVSFLEATVRLTPAPKVRVLLVLGYPDVVRAAEAVPEVLAAGPIGLEGMDRFLVDNELTRRSYRETLARLPPGDAWLLVEFGGETREEAPGASPGDWRPARTRSCGDSGRAGEDLAGARGRGGDDLARSPPRRRLAGLGGLGGGARALRRLSPRPPRPPRPSRLSRGLLRPLRGGVPPRAHRLRLQHAGGDPDLPRRSWKRRRTWWWRTAARSPASTATASSAASSSPACSATSWSRPSASSRRSGTPATG